MKWMIWLIGLIIFGLGGFFMTKYFDFFSILVLLFGGSVIVIALGFHFKEKTGF